MDINDFRTGQTVRIHPASDWFMRGFQFVEVVKVGRKLLTVRSPFWFRPFTIDPAHIIDIEQTS